jgi:Cu(I)/Ag(I) efflux system membrane protein CusA/SilA
MGLAAQTGVVMVVYIDEAYHRRKRAGLIRSLDDIVAAHLEGTVQRLRPKLMTVGTMLAGLVPLLWASSSGADVMKRVAAPMVGGLVSSAFLTLEVIPVIVTYWRGEQLVWERAAGTAAATRMARAARAAAWCGIAAMGIAVLPIYAAVPGRAAAWGVGAALAGGLACALGYLRARPASGGQ